MQSLLDPTAPVFEAAAGEGVFVAQVGPTNAAGDAMGFKA